jgi:hypothetical protein
MAMKGDNTRTSRNKISGSLVIYGAPNISYDQLVAWLQRM